MRKMMLTNGGTAVFAAILLGVLAFGCHRPPRDAAFYNSVLVEVYNSIPLGTDHQKVESLVLSTQKNEPGFLVTENKHEIRLCPLSDQARWFLLVGFQDDKAALIAIRSLDQLGKSPENAPPDKRKN